MLKDRKVEAKVRGKKKHELKNRFSCFAQAVAKCTESGSLPGICQTKQHKCSLNAQRVRSSATSLK